jgi:hypothetical protein
MNSTVATEVTERPATRPLLETWGKNERMRHVPPVEWMIEKLDRDLRRRIVILCASATSTNDVIDSAQRGLCRAIDRLGDIAKYSRAANHAPAEMGARLDFAITHAVSCLRSLDANLFGRRYPFQNFERSKAEPIWGAFLVVIDRVHRLASIARAMDPLVDERLLEGLVQLREGLRQEAIA